jgi:hypothetical protein
LIIKNHLGAGDTILKTEKIKSILKEYYNDENKVINIITERDNFYEIIREETSKEEWLEMLKVGGEIRWNYLNQLESFTNDACLVLSLYDNSKQYINAKITIDDWRYRRDIGKIPLKQVERLPFIYGHSFLDVLVKISNVMFVLSDERKTPIIPNEFRGELRCIKNDFDASFPHLRNIRNSWQHIEDRMRGKKIGERDIGGRLLVLSSFMNDELSYTVADGSVQSLLVSLSTLRKAEGYVQRIFNCLDWVESNR